MAVLRAILILTAVLAATAQIDSPINGRPVTVLQTGLPEQSSSSQPEDPSITGPNQVFSGEFYGENPTSAGVNNGAGDQTAGVSANAFGHGETTYAGGQLTQNHFEPHGVDYAVTAEGQQYGGTVGANPDGLGGEGPVVEATGRK
ncbi:hypothetical protein WJX73_004509 [Symbiochloris irregularis]|uniref:Uncharacterized protein n=1 Tax=Symbiochloris irregularis TaxID=706552 RepID=A0AAW1P048_9CHLO